MRIEGVVDKIYDINEDLKIDFDLWGKISVNKLNHQQALDEIKEKLSNYIRFEYKPVFSVLKSVFPFLKSGENDVCLVMSFIFPAQIRISSQKEIQFFSQSVFIL